MDSSFKIPKRAVDVEVRDARGTLTKGQLFLARAASSGARDDRVQDLLQHRRFIPIRVGERIVFQATGQIAWVRFDVIAAFDELDAHAEGADGSIGAGVRVELDDGSEVAGGIRYFLPPAIRRVSDYLENLDGFFPLRTPDWLYVINRERVLRVQTVDEVIS